MKTKRDLLRRRLPRSHTKGQQGFALIATITLMVLLALLSVGLLSIAATQTRLSEKGLYASDARAQARLAMEVALGKLQAELGPDQRITANSSIMDTSPTSANIDGVACPHILGVWDSWDTWINRQHSTRGLRIGASYDKARSRLFRSWLISSADHRELSNLNSATRELGTSRGSRGSSKVQLVGPGTLGDDRQDSSRVFAELVQIDDSVDANANLVSRKNSQLRKSIAWWVSGENQKVRINLPKYLSSNNNDTMSVMRSTWDTPTPDNETIDQLRRLNGSMPAKDSPEYDRKVRQLISRGTLNLAAGQGSGGDLGMVYHDITLSSSGIPADVKFGGLKKDINIMLSGQELPEDYRTTASQDIGLRPYSTEDGSATVTNRPISSWNQLHLWSNVWDSNTMRQGQDASANLVWNGNAASTFIAGDAESSIRMLDNRYTYLRQPILLKLYVFVGVQYGLKFVGNKGTAESYLDQYVKKNKGNVLLRMSIFPIQVWWNPYNVDMPLQGPGDSPLGAYVSQHRMMPLVASDNVASELISNPSMDNYDLRPTRDFDGPDNKVDESKLQNLEERGLTAFLRETLDTSAGQDSYIGKNRKVGRQVQDYGSTFRNKVDVHAKQYNDPQNGEVTKGDVSTLKAGEIVVFSYPEVFADIVDNTYYNYNVIEYVRKTQQDFVVDYMPMSEGWAESEEQTGAWSILARESMHELRYDGLTGPDYSDKSKYKLNIRFADSTDLTKLTPDDFILSKRFATHNKDSKDLGTFTFQAGLMDVGMIGKRQNPVAKDRGGCKDPEIYTKTLPSVFFMNWGAWEEKLIDSVDFPQDYWDNDVYAWDNRQEKWRAAGYGGAPIVQRNSATGAPEAVFISYYGISSKWGRTPMIGNYPKDRDYRAKIWQHSSPLFFGSQMTNASELGRSYSPYQFEINYASNDFAPITVANVLSNSGTRMNIFGGPGSEEINKIIAAELPFHPPYSLAGYAGMRLTPGWYNTTTMADTAKRFGYQSGVPGVGIGNSYADPMIPADQIFSHNEITNDPELGDFWDHGQMVNDGLWDSWYASSLSSRPTGFNGSSKEELEQVAQKAFERDTSSSGEESTDKLLANKRFTVRHEGRSAETIVSELTAEDGYTKSAKYIRVDGAFNVNSTSLVAWKAILAGLKDRDILYMDGSTPRILSKPDNTTVFARFGITSNQNSHVDDMGAVGVSNGLMDGDAQVWSDLRKVDQSQMDQLAEKLVEQVKKRGPFLNMAEFINRRLEAGELGVKGALQTAIDESGMNSVFDSIGDKIIDPAAQYPHHEAARGSFYTAAPGYLIQSDVLAVLGNILTVRDDTFTIRAYGEVANKSGTEILSRAWCEATVQRTVDYVDPSDEPETPARQIDTLSGQLTDGTLSLVNRAFGRKFVVTSFRWLSSDEV